MNHRIGIDLGGTKTEILALDQDNRVAYRYRTATPSQDYDAILQMVETEVRRAESELGTEASIGIGTPGALSPDNGLLRNSNTVVMNGRAVRDDLESRLQREIRIENDANCFALSEARHGAGKEFSVVFGVIIGTGTGGGIVVDGKLINGPHSISGEWGHNPMPWHREEDGSPSCYCGKQACIETFLSGPGLAASYERGFGQPMSSEQIVRGVQTGDIDCKRVLKRYCDQMARALAHLINILDPDAIVLGGGMSNIAAIYEDVPAQLSDYVFSEFVRTPILKAEHGDASGVFGAAMLWD